MGEMLDYIRSTARFDLPEVALAACIAFSGMILGRRVRATDDTRPNIYCLSIAESGTGKNHARQTIKRIMYESGIPIPAEGAASATGLVKNLARYPSMTMQIDEAGLVFRQMKNPRSPQAEVGAQLSELFTGSQGIYTYRAYADALNEVQIDQPHLSLNATTTEQSLYAGGFNHEDAEQGLFGRFLIFRPEQMDPPEQFDLEVTPLPKSIIDGVKSWWDFQPWNKLEGANLLPDHPTPMIVPFSDDAKKRYRVYATQIAERLQNENAFVKALWRRSREKTSRLALIHACMQGGKRDGIVIERSSMDWAIAVNNYSTRGMVFDMDHAMVESNYQRDVQYVLSKIPASGIERWRLNKSLGRLKQKERDEILTDLVQRGEIRFDENKTGGPPSITVHRS